MNPPPRHVDHTSRLAADNEAPSEAMKSPPEDHVTDDAAGDEGIDDPAVDD